jgi:polyhydroxyalkanoate synthesis regulator phasin
MAEEGKGGVREGLRNSVGLLVAFKEAVQETLEEARDRGDFSTDKAKALVQEAAQRVQHSVDEARERLDFVPRKEFDELKAELEALRERVSRMESPASRDAPISASGSVPEAGSASAADAGSRSEASGPASGTESFPVD